MRLEELEAVCQEAARGVLDREGRPVPPAVVLPLPAATKVVTFPEFPEDDAERRVALAHFAHERMAPVNAPCYGFVAEGEQPDGTSLLVVVYGARGHAAQITAAVLDGMQLGPWAPPEELHADAMPFLAVLQAAADAANPAEPAGGGIPGFF